MKGILVRCILLAALALLPGCPGVGVGATCTRHADGSIECSVEAHNDGNHEKPVK
jgi:hypothetical protein